MLYVVATPIGNLGDITLRALETLRKVDLIAAEDTRHTMGLLSHYDIHKPVVSYYEHNKMARGPELLEKLGNGAEIALVSDAGTPGISDPGHELIRDAINAGIPVTVVPGAVAGITALVLSGFPTDRFVFEGFLSQDKKQRKIFREQLRKETRSMILYEAPHRLLRTLDELSQWFTQDGTPQRRIAVCRELTKAFEEACRGTASQLLEHFTINSPRGEFVLIIEGAQLHEETISYQDEDLYQMVATHLSQGHKPGDAMRLVAEETGLKKNAIYAACERVKAGADLRNCITP